MEGRVCGDSSRVQPPLRCERFIVHELCPKSLCQTPSLITHMFDLASEVLQRKPGGRKTSKHISPFEAGMVGGLVILVSFLGVQEKGLL